MTNRTVDCLKIHEGAYLTSLLWFVLVCLRVGACVNAVCTCLFEHEDEVMG